MARTLPTLLLPLLIAASAVRLPDAAGAGESHPAPAPVLPDRMTVAEADAALDRARRWFDAGAHAEADALLAALFSHPDFTGRGATAALAADETSRSVFQARSEDALMLWGRTRFALAHEPDEYLAVAAAFGQLADNRYRFEHPRRQPEARFRMASALAAAGRYDRAAREFDASYAPGLPPELHGAAARGAADARRRLAETLPDADPERGRLLDRAAADLFRAETLAPDEPARDRLALDRAAVLLARRRPEADLEALATLDHFLATRPPPEPARVHAALLRLEARRRQDDSARLLAAADTLLAEGIDDPALRRDAELLRARAARELARGAPPAEHRRRLETARDAYAAALADAPRRDPRWETPRLEAARVLLDLGDARATLDLLEPLLVLSPWRPRAHRLAGDAHRALERRSDAEQHYRRAALADRAEGPDVEAERRDALVALARLGADFGRPLDAAVWWSRAAAAARRDRAFDLLAQATFGLARARLDVARPDTGGDFPAEALRAAAAIVPPAGDGVAAAPESGPARLAAALVELLETARRRGVGTAELPATLRERSAETAVAAATLSEAAADPMASVLSARRLLEHLRRRQPGRVPESALDHLEALADFRRVHGAAVALVDVRAAALPPPDDSTMPGLFVPLYPVAAPSGGGMAGSVDALFDQAQRAVARLALTAVEVARTGVMSAAPSDAGDARLALERLARRLADLRTREGDAIGAAMWSEQARRQGELALEPLESSALDPALSPADRWRARWLRGQALEALDRHAEAAREFALLATDRGRVVAAAAGPRAAAARRWAANLAAAGETRAAVERLAAWSARDAEAALAAGRLHEKLEDVRAARRDYARAAAPDAPAYPPFTPHRPAEAAYRLARLLAERADALADVGAGETPAMLRSDAALLLERLVETSDAGPWAAYAAGARLEELRRSDPALALARAGAWAARENAAPATRRTAWLAQARLFREAGDLDQAAAVATEAAASAAADPEGRRDGWRARLALLAVSEAKGELGAALSGYLEVFSRNSTDPELSDIGRLGAARVYYARAIAAHEAGRDDYADEYAASVRAMLAGLHDPDQGVELAERLARLAKP